MSTHGWCENLTVVAKELANERLDVPSKPSQESLL